MPIEESSHITDCRTAIGCLTSPSSCETQPVVPAKKLPIRAHVIELRPTPEQSDYLLRSAGTMRYVYNQLVAKIRAGESYDRKTFQKFCSTLRQATPWMQEVTSRATYEAADNFNVAMKNFFASCEGKRKGSRVSLPNFKKKGKSPAVVRYSHYTQFSLNGRSLKISGLKKKYGCGKTPDSKGR